MTAAVAGLLLGLIVFADPKGTPVHRLLGVAFALAMLTVNITALGLYRLTGSFGAFHVLALLSLLALARGLWPLVRRRTGWLNLHYRYMAISYGGLVAAALAETLTRLPAARGLLNTPSRIIAMGVAIAVLVFVGLRLILPRFERQSLQAALAHMQANKT
ncbi:MAG: DUF2306 domain-containing protein [Rhodospirillaceae bacterium]|nr:DUF2306 domain-containing protein [Rhodospirillaceae bacterium]